MEQFIKDNLLKVTSMVKEILFIQMYLSIIKIQGNYYKATWEQGKMITGELIFADNLKYQTSDWPHCINNDRRFYQ